MNRIRFWLLAGFVILLVSSTACVSRPTPVPDLPKASETTAPPASTPASMTPKAPATGLASPTAAVSGATAATATVVAIPADVEVDCMAECHVPNPNDFIDAGAMPQPASHAGRTTCLACHSTLTKPVLPATHLGRMDPSCTVCHK